MILISHQLRKFFELEADSSERSKSSRNLQNTVNNCLSVLQSYNISVISWDPFLVFWVSSKLPEETFTAWENSIDNHKEMSSWHKLNECISNRLDFLESISDIRKPTLSSQSTSQKTQSFHVKSDTSHKPCKLNKQNHALRICRKFKSITLAGKTKHITDNNACINCLFHGHTVGDCRSNKLCQVCNQQHHTLLHPESSHARSPNQQRINGHGNSPARLDGHTNPTSFHLLTQEEDQPTSSNQIQSHFSESGHGSQETFISGRIVAQLAIPKRKFFTRISGLEGNVLENSSKVCAATLKSRKSQFFLETTMIVISNLNHFMLSTAPSISGWDGLNELDLANPCFYLPAQIDILRGSDILPPILKSGVQKNLFVNLLAQESEFGWFISGPLMSRSVTTFATWANYPTTILNEEVRKIWEIYDKQQMFEADVQCERF